MRLSRARILMGLLLLLACYVAGSSALDSPFIAGDEQIFIEDNSDVTGQGRPEHPARRLLAIFTHFHEDLYQPVPVFTYAVEWLIWPGDAAAKAPFIRNTDVLIHALNALLFWGALSALLKRLGAADPATASLVAWLGAALWALHPVNVSTYAADMGRTHLLAATFCLLSLRLHDAAITGAGGRGLKFAASVAALLLAMASKPIVGWVGLVFAFEWAVLGRRAAIRSPRVYVVGLICAFFAALTIYSSRTAGLLEDAEMSLFGDRISRSLLAAWLYFRNIVAPFWISTWYLPDIRTGWGYPLVWLGVGLLLASAWAVFHSSRNPRAHGLGLSLVWYWALLFPVLGFVGGRVAAAQDRYIYQPLMGLVFLVALAAVRWISLRPPRRRWVTFGALLLAVAMLPHSAALAGHARSQIRRQARVVALNPGDPRASEGLAAAYDFSQTNDTPEGRANPPPDFRSLFERTLDRTVSEAQAAPHFLPTDNDRAAFHRRISRLYMHAGAPEKSLAQAELARRIEPDAVLSWLRLAVALRVLGRLDETRAAYERIESLLRPDSPGRANRLTEFGLLLQSEFQDNEAARIRFLAVLEPLFDLPPLDIHPTQRVRKLVDRISATPDAANDTARRLASDAANLVAAVGLARAEVRAGQGAVGFGLVRCIRALFPDLRDARLVEAEYHLRSGHWDDAARSYGELLRDFPSDYDVLLGFHEVCARQGDWRSAMLAWNRAASLPGENQRIFQSFFVWSAVCAAEPQARAWSEALLRGDASNQLGLLSRMLLALREGDIETAVAFAHRAGAATALPRSRALERAAATLDAMASRGELLSEADIVRAALQAALGDFEQARALLDGYLSAQPDVRWRELARSMRVNLP